jgi:hypothetical protein
MGAPQRCMGNPIVGTLTTVTPTVTPTVSQCLRVNRIASAKSMPGGRLHCFTTFNAWRSTALLRKMLSKVVQIISNFERLHKIKKEAFAENFSCLSHWEGRNLPRPP